MTVRAALLEGARLLEDAHVPAPRLTAEVLLSHALRKERIYLYSHSTEELSELAWLHYGRYLHERLSGRPTQYITGRQEFYGREFTVSADVLIPRPETEHLVDAALRLWPEGGRAVDVGCGSGAIAITLAAERHLRVWATDISLAAVRVAADNALRLGAEVEFTCCDLLAGFAGQTFDLVASNPPYVSCEDRGGLQREVRDYEPPAALYAGSTGNEIYERLIHDSERTLRPGGMLVMELGYRSLEPVRALLGPAWDELEVATDLAGIPRVLAARFKG